MRARFFLLLVFCTPLLADDLKNAPSLTELHPMDHLRPLDHQPLKVKSVVAFDEEGSASSLPFCIVRAEYLRQHQDEIMAISYLRRIIQNSSLSPEHRARAILELADCLESQQQPGEALYWLKLWMGQYSGRSETGAVAHRIGSLYARMQLPNLARDAYYEALSASVNQAQIKDEKDLQLYSSLTLATLWNLAENEFQSGHWDRAAELYARYQKEGAAAPPLSLEEATYREGDCAFALEHWKEAEDIYLKVLAEHPFNPNAPETRLKLYRQYFAKGEKALAAQELVSLMWTVKTAWPKAEQYWIKRTAVVLLQLNSNDQNLLPNLIQKLCKINLGSDDKPWQTVLSHYGLLCSLQANKSYAGENKNLNANRQLKPVVQDDEAIEKLTGYLNYILPRRSS